MPFPVSSFCAPTKLETLSPRNTLMFPLRTTKRRRACMKESVSRLQVHSIWTTLLDKDVNSAPYLLSSFLPSFIRKGPNMSAPQFVKGSSSIVLSVGRSVIFCSPSFPCNNRHLTHFPTKLLTIALHRTNQNQVLLISLMVSPLSPWAVFWWHHSTINLVMQLSLLSNVGWISVKWKFDFLSSPPTLGNPLSSIKGSFFVNTASFH